MSAGQKMIDTPSIERLRELFAYDPGTGVITRLVAAGRSPSMSVAGTISDTGYLVIKADGKKLKAHRLAWAIHNGAWPQNHLDHINGVKTDNRISNLRDVTVAQNLQNQRSAQASNTSCKFLGVSWDKRKKLWVAQIQVNRKGIYIGRFKTAEEAHAAYVQKKRELHPTCTF